MDAIEIIVTALTPGSPFNNSGRVWRSLESLASLTQLPGNEVMSILGGDLAADVSVRPGKKGPMVAMKVHIPAKIKAVVETPAEDHGACAIQAPVHVAVPAKPMWAGPEPVDLDEGYDDPD